MSSNEIEDRRQRAREAAYDTKDFSPYVRPGAEAVESAIEVATRVKITDESTRSLISFGMTDETARSVLRWSLTELGFEVIE